MKQQQINVGDVEYELMHIMYAKHGRVVVKCLTVESVARLCGVLGSGGDPATLIDEHENDSQEQHRQYPPGLIEERYMLRGEPLPSRIHARAHDQHIDAPKAHRGGVPAARPVVSGVSIASTIESLVSEGILATHTADESEPNDWCIPDRNAIVPIVGNEGTHFAAPKLDACLMSQGDSPGSLMAQTMYVVDCIVAEAKPLADSDEPPPHPGLFGCVYEDNMQDIVDLIYG